MQSTRLDALRMLLDSITLYTVSAACQSTLELDSDFATLVLTRIRLKCFQKIIAQSLPTGLSYVPINSQCQLSPCELL